ncbi:MAG: DUF2339 domain-containing protein [Proteobacteria bacterium]|nr:DUF2339 domain-containing protein [Pseudomonadota bacterium]
MDGLVVVAILVSLLIWISPSVIALILLCVPLLQNWFLSQRTRRLERDLKSLAQMVGELAAGPPRRSAVEPIEAPTDEPVEDAVPESGVVQEDRLSTEELAEVPSRKPAVPPPEVLEEPKAEQEPEAAAAKEPDEGVEKLRGLVQSLETSVDRKFDKVVEGDPWGAFTKRVAKVIANPPSVEIIAVWIASGLFALFVFLGLILALGIVFHRGWVSPSIRITMGLVSGVGIWGLGEIIRRRFPIPASALAGSGMAVLYGSLFASHGMYRLLPSGVVAAAMIGVTSAAVLIASRRADRFMAYVGLIGGILTPVMVSTGANKPVALFSYLTLVIGGFIAVALWRTWWDVVFTAALGAGLLYFGWTASWYVADQAPFGLMAAVSLSLPFAVVAGWYREHKSIWQILLTVSGFVGLAWLAMLALPWMMPVDPIFYDPFNYTSVYRSLHGEVWWIGGALVGLLLPAWIAARRTGHWAWSLGVSAIACVLIWFTASAWSILHEPQTNAFAGVFVGVLLMGVLLHGGARKLGWGLMPLPIVIGWALAGLLAVEPSGFIMLAVAVLAVICAFAALFAASPWILLSAVVAVTPALIAGALQIDTIGTSMVVGPTLIAYAALSYPPLIIRWAKGAQAAWAASAMAGPAMFIPLYLAWTSGLGDDAIGVLPLLVGINALFAAAVLVRVYRVGRNNLALALFVGVALLGFTGALPIQLQEGWLTVAWALEALALAWLASRLTHPLVRWTAISLAVTVAIRLLFNPWALSYGDATGWPVLNWTLYTWGIPALSLLLASRWLRLSAIVGEGTKQSELARIQNIAVHVFSAVVLLLGLLVAFALVNVEVSHLFQDAGPIELSGRSLWQGMVRSVSWGSYGFVLLVVGVLTKGRMIRLIGFGFILLAAMKVALVDLLVYEGFVRVGSLLGLALFLLMAALLFAGLELRKNNEEKES